MASTYAHPHFSDMINACHPFVTADTKLDIAAFLFNREDSLAFNPTYLASYIGEHWGPHASQLFDGYFKFYASIETFWYFYANPRLKNALRNGDSTIYDHYYFSGIERGALMFFFEHLRAFEKCAFGNTTSTYIRNNRDNYATLDDLNKQLGTDDSMFREIMGVHACNVLASSSDKTALLETAEYLAERHSTIFALVPKIDFKFIVSLVDRTVNPRRVL